MNKPHIVRTVDLREWINTADTIVRRGLEWLEQEDFWERARGINMTLAIEFIAAHADESLLAVTHPIPA